MPLDALEVPYLTGLDGLLCIAVSDSALAGLEANGVRTPGRIGTAP